MILICYDGSEDARTAIEHGSEILRGQPATVLTVWEPFSEVMTHTALGMVPMVPGGVDMEQIDQASREQAEKLAAEGAERARSAGFDAQGRTCAQATSVARTILDEAAAVQASAILMGSRGLTGVRSMLLGSVSHAVMQHADRTVIVVPSEKVVAARQHRPD